MPYAPGIMEGIHEHVSQRTPRPSQECPPTREATEDGVAQIDLLRQLLGFSGSAMRTIHGFASPCNTSPTLGAQFCSRSWRGRYRPPDQPCRAKPPGLYPLCLSHRRTLDNILLSDCSTQVYHSFRL